MAINGFQKKLNTDKNLYQNQNKFQNRKIYQLIFKPN
jgi:hypothetical protein